MSQVSLVPHDLELVRSVLRQHPEIESATLFGSRAKGTHAPLLEHIRRVGQVIYRSGVQP